MALFHCCWMEKSSSIVNPWTVLKSTSTSWRGICCSTLRSIVWTSRPPLDILSIGGNKMGCDNNDMDGFYRPVPRFNGSGLGVFLSPEVREMETEADYAEARLAKMNAGERALFGMLHLGGAFRFIEKLSRSEVGR